CGMNGAGDEDYRLALLDQLFGLGWSGSARVGQAALDVLVAVKLAEGIGRRDGDGDEGAAFGGFAQLGYFEAIGGFLQGAEPCDDFVPVEDGFVGADFVTEVSRGRGDGSMGSSQKCQGKASGRQSSCGAGYRARGP